MQEMLSRFPLSPVRAKHPHLSTGKRHSLTVISTTRTKSSTKSLNTEVANNLTEDLSHLQHLYDLPKLHETHRQRTMSAAVASPAMQRYKFIKWLGEGTDGLVFCAWDTESSHKVAIKAISKKSERSVSRDTSSDDDEDCDGDCREESDSEDEEDVEVRNRLRRAMKEVRYLRRLDHPNVIRVHQVVDTEQELFVVMDYADAGDLFEFMYKLNEADITLEAKEAIAKRIFMQTLLAVEHCHKYHIAHRDLKPENILLTSDLTVKLADFGLASRFASGTTLNSYVGSLVYASPEVLSGLPYSAPEVDIWALGILLCELLCGVYPFGDSAGQSPREDRRICANILRCKYELPQEDEIMSPLARDLIARILQPVETRISLQGIKNHLWLASTPSSVFGEGNKENAGVEIEEEDAAAAQHDQERKTKRSNSSNEQQEERMMDGHMPKGLKVRSGSGLNVLKAAGGETTTKMTKGQKKARAHRDSSEACVSLSEKPLHQTVL